MLVQLIWRSLKHGYQHVPQEHLHDLGSLSLLGYTVCSMNSRQLNIIMIKREMSGETRQCLILFCLSGIVTIKDFYALAPWWCAANLSPCQTAKCTNKIHTLELYYSPLSQDNFLGPFSPSVNPN